MTDVLSDSDPVQVQLMKERVILVDPSDTVIGHMSKKDSHLLSNDLPLHRAFSLFLFDQDGRMLLQQRAPTKVTFPSFWTNTVCSHPLYRPEELGDDANDPTLGAKRAVIRKIDHELGVGDNSLETSDLHYLTRIRYRAHCDDGIWGEHELDYIFFAQKNVTLKPEPNEVCNTRYVSVPELKSMFLEADNDRKISLTPWFRHIMKSFGWEWWKILLDHGLQGLQKAQDSETVHAMGDCGPSCISQALQNDSDRSKQNEQPM